MIPRKFLSALLLAPFAVSCALAAISGAGAESHTPSARAIENLGATEYVAGTARTNVEQPPATPTPQQLRVRNTVLIGGGALLVGAYGWNRWWQDGFSGRFGTVNEGWFGRDTPHGGADKFGHAYFSYAGTRLLAQGLAAAGNDRDTAHRLGALWTLGIMTGIEVLDGYSKRFDFSKEDALVNLTGAGLGYLLERNREFDDLIDFRLHYWPSAGSKFDPAGDYSGQTYLIVAKASGVPALRRHDVLRYLEFAVGYGTRGYENAHGAERRRNLYAGISLNVSEVLRRTVFRSAREPGTGQRSAELFFEFVQAPGTAALARHSR